MPRPGAQRIVLGKGGLDPLHVLGQTAAERAHNHHRIRVSIVGPTGPESVLGVSLLLVCHIQKRSPQGMAAPVEQTDQLVC